MSVVVPLCHYPPLASRLNENTPKNQSKDHPDAVCATLGAVTLDPSQGFSTLQRQTRQLVFGGKFPLRGNGEGDHLDTAACRCWLWVPNSLGRVHIQNVPHTVF